MSLSITPKIMTANGYMKYGFTELQSADKRVRAPTLHPRTDPDAFAKMKKKLMRGLIVLLKNRRISGRLDAYEILKERGFLPVVAEYKTMSYSRFMYYYGEARNHLGITSVTDTKKEFILNNFKTMSADAIAQHVGSHILYVQQTIAKFKRGK